MVVINPDAAIYIAEADCECGAKCSGSERTLDEPRIDDNEEAHDGKGYR